MPAFDVQNVHGSGQGEATGRQHHAAHYVEADPQPPGELIVQVSGSAEAVGEADVGGVNASRHDGEEYGLPEGEAKPGDGHCAPP